MESVDFLAICTCIYSMSRERKWQFGCCLNLSLMPPGYFVSSLLSGVLSTGTIIVLAGIVMIRSAFWLLAQAMKLKQSQIFARPVGAGVVADAGKRELAKKTICHPGVNRSLNTPGIGSSRSKWAMLPVGFTSGNDCSSSLSAACNCFHCAAVGQSRSDCQ